MMPRRARPVGRRQFSPGTEEDWRNVLESSHVKRALEDPAIANALYQNFRGMGGQVPQAPVPMQRGGAVRFADGGGYGMSDEEIAIQDQINKLERGNAEDKAQAARLRAAQNKLAQARLQGGTGAGPVSLGGNTISGSTMAGLNKLTGPVTTGNMAASILGGAAMAGGSSGSATGALIGAATAGLLNYFIRKNAQKKQQQQGTATEPTQQQPQQQTTPPPTPTPPATPAQPADTTPAQPTPPAKPASTGDAIPVESAKAWLPKSQWGEADKFQGKATQQAKPDVVIANPTPGSTAPTTPSGPGLWMGTSTTGNNVVSYNGKDWIDEQTKRPVTGAISGPTMIGSYGSGPTPPAATATSPGFSLAPATGTSDLGATDALSGGLGSVAPFSTPFTDFEDNFYGYSGGGPVRQFAEGGLPPPPRKEPKAVLVRRPPGHVGMPIPILHTTIVIAAKPKGRARKAETKQTGGLAAQMSGSIPQAERRPRRPNAIPPVAGPGDGQRPRPHGRVQVPRGSGAAIKGKRFGGIY